MKNGAARARGSAVTAYLTVWALLAAAALAYLAMLAIRPELLARSFARPGTDAEAARSLAKVAGELHALRQIAADTKIDIADIKTRIASQEERSGTLSDRMSAIEQRIVGTPAAQGKQPTSQIVTGSLAPAAAAAPAAVNAVQFGQIEVKHGAPVALKLATRPTVEALRLSWQLISELHRAQLKSLEPRYVGAPDGTSFTLVAGPVATREEAQRLCRTLKARRVNCAVADYVGEPL